MKKEFIHIQNKKNKSKRIAFGEHFLAPYFLTNYLNSLNKEEKEFFKNEYSYNLSFAEKINDSIIDILSPLDASFFDDNLNYEKKIANFTKLCYSDDNNVKNLISYYINNLTKLYIKNKGGKPYDKYAYFLSDSFREFKKYIHHDFLNLNPFADYIDNDEIISKKIDEVKIIFHKIYMDANLVDKGKKNTILKKI